MTAATAAGSLTVERRGPASARSRAAERALAPMMRRLFEQIGRAAETPETMRAFAATADRMIGRFPVPRGTRVAETRVGGVAAEWVRGPGVTGPGDAVVLYLHGGGWFLGGPSSHRALVARLSTAAGNPALSVDYRMVPEVPFDEEIDDCVAAYEGVLALGVPASRVVVMGDSAGGHLAFATALRARDRSLPVPAGVVSLSGALDLGLSAAADPERDPLGAVAAFERLAAGVLDGADPADPAVSPVHADLAGLPPAVLTAGSTEVVAPHAETMATRLGEAGIPTVLQLWDRQQHVFQAFAPAIPEAVASIVDLGRRVRGLVAGRGPEVRVA
jgi:epsilon-lactone hydrolase